MNNFMVLLVGELQRMKKYNILTASVVVSLIWILVLHFTGIENVDSLFIMMVFVDVTTMSMLLVGVTMFFEKQEGALKTLLVSPINKSEYILAKSFTNIVSNLESLIILYLYAYFFKEITINIFWMIGVVVLVGLFHALLGFWLTYHSRDFTELLMGMLKYAFVTMLPVFIGQVGMIKSDFLQKLLYVVPPKSSMVLLEATAGGVALWEILLSSGYLLAGSVGMYLIVSKQFDEFAIKESGV